MVEFERLGTPYCTHPESLLEALLIEVVDQKQNDGLHSLETCVGVQEARLYNGPCELVNVLLPFAWLILRPHSLHDLEDVSIRPSTRRELDAHCDGHKSQCKLVLRDFTCPLVGEELPESVLDGGKVDTTMSHGLATPLEDVVDESKGRMEGADVVASVCDVLGCYETSSEMRWSRTESDWLPLCGSCGRR